MVNRIDHCGSTQTQENQRQNDAQHDRFPLKIGRWRDSKGKNASNESQVFAVVFNWISNSFICQLCHSELFPLPKVPPCLLSIAVTSSSRPWDVIIFPVSQHGNAKSARQVQAKTIKKRFMISKTLFGHNHTGLENEKGPRKTRP